MTDASSPRAPQQHRDYGTGPEARAARLDDECAELGDRQAARTEARIDAANLTQPRHQFGNRRLWMLADPTDPWSALVHVDD
jgi:hypothetical protein